MRRTVACFEFEDYFDFSAEKAEKSIRESCNTSLFVERRAGQNHNISVVCDPNFMSQLLPYLNWGEKTPVNYLEDIFHISGEIYRSGEKTILIPRFLIKAVSPDRRKTSVITSVDNKQMSAKQNAMISACLRESDFYWLSEFAPLEIIGHGHTHPGLFGIGTRPSSTDRVDHGKNVVDCKFWLSVICDPIRRDISFYCGESMERPDVVLMFYPKDSTVFNYGTSIKRVLPDTLPVHIKSYPDGMITEPAFSVSEEAVAEIENEEEAAESEEIEIENEKVESEKAVENCDCKNTNCKKHRVLKKKVKREIKKLLSGCDDYKRFLDALAELLDE